ncbi:MAG: bacillithiol system redox-active protein YtxJ [Bacteroidota bacterium]
MVNWIPLASIAEVEELVQQSETVPCLIFKHSIRCSISSFAKQRLEQSWDLPVENIQPFYLDLINYREVSNYIADHFAIEHESPQILLIERGKVVYDASHLAISVDDIRDQLLAAS